MKRHALLSLLSLCLLSAVLAFPGQGKGAEAFEYNFQSIYAGPHALNLQVFQPWAEGLAEKTGGRLNVHFFMNGALVRMEEVLPALINGNLDLGSGLITYQDTLMPHSQALTLFHIARDCAHSSEIYWQMYEQLPEVKAEFDKVGKLLTLWGSDRSGFFSTKGPIRTPGDVKGKRVLIWDGAQVDTVRSWGGIPVQVSPNDTYIGLQRGMGDVFFGPLPVGVAYKLMEVTKDVSVFPAHVGVSALWVNWDVWKELPPDLQKALEADTGRAMNRRCGQVLKAATDRDIETMKAAGCAVYSMTPEDLKLFEAADAEVLNAYRLGEMKRLGVTDPAGWLKKVDDMARSVPYPGA